jgi:hypothetical protein
MKDVDNFCEGNIRKLICRKYPKGKVQAIQQLQTVKEVKGKCKVVPVL